MKKGILLNSDISAVVARLGHTDRVTIADCGLPIRGQAQRIDLALKFGVPSFLETLDTVLEEMKVQKIILAEEITSVSLEMDAAIRRRFGSEVAVEYVPHEDFKKLTEQAAAVVRTGECTSYANVILEFGVTF